MSSDAAELLVLGNHVVIEFGSWSRVERDRLLAMGRTAGAGVELHVLDLGANQLWQRLSERNTAPGQGPIDRKTLDDGLKSWEPPDAAELARYDPPVT